MSAEPEAAVLFADVSGSTKLYETAGDQAAHAAIERCIVLMRQKTEAAKGKVIKTIGDEVLSTFPDADAAADAAIEMQSAISELLPVGGTKIGIRVGFYFGPLVHKDGDIFGDAVNVASRLSHVAVKGQIITSRETVMLMSPMLKSATRKISQIAVKGKSEPVEAYELMWQQSEDATTMAAARSVLKPKKTSLRLLLQGGETMLSDERTAVSMGRDQSADLVVRDKMASRSHGKIERRLDKFILTDHSANGTYVTVDGDKEIVLRREEFTLRGKGWITFGQSRSTATDVLEFTCE
ncbi:MAG: adenylate/guanylate cyclase domain-containing protein [Betaproteobacteria bacterium]